jgi:hypothetical protein
VGRARMCRERNGGLGGRGTGPPPTCLLFALPGMLPTPGGRIVSPHPPGEKGCLSASFRGEGLSLCILPGRRAVSLHPSGEKGLSASFRGEGSLRILPGRRVSPHPSGEGIASPACPPDWSSTVSMCPDARLRPSGRLWGTGDPWALLDRGHSPFLPNFFWIKLARPGPKRARNGASGYSSLHKNATSTELN